jgi:hypothetical protein
MATSMEAFEETMRRARGEAVASGPAAAPAPAQPAPGKSSPVRRELPKVGRNALVRIRKGDRTQELKWKKAEVLVREEGWELDAILSE